MKNYLYLCRNGLRVSPAATWYENAPHEGDTQVVIVNELFAYCAFHADRSTTDVIKDVLVRFYTPDEI